MNPHRLLPFSRFSRSTIPVILALTALCVSPLRAVTFGQVDTFEDGTTQDWRVGVGPFAPTHPAPPANVLGGPAGADDNFLQINSVGGAGPGSRLAVINFNSQWAGDYIAAGIASIGMYVFNYGNVDLYLRLMFEDPLAGPPQNIAYSADPILVAAGSGWTWIEFPIEIPNLDAALGDVTTALTNTTALRIFHSENGGLAEPVVAQLGIDNIQTLGTAVPEGSTTVILLASALTALAAARVRLRPSGMN
jgi:hypothetical protein